MIVIHVKCRNNADARRIGQGLIKVPGATKVTHSGRKDVVIETEDLRLVKNWLDSSFEVESYEI